MSNENNTKAVREKVMLRRLMIAAISAAALVVSTTAYAQKAEYGTAAEAKAMLERTVAAIKADKAKTLAMINKGEGGFVDRDLYAACSTLDGKVTAHPDQTRLGMNRNDMKDVTGKAYGQEILKVAAEGKIAEVTYMFPRLGADRTPVQKVSLVTMADDQICLVGYYK
jgi:hypothetical protein